MVSRIRAGRGDMARMTKGGAHGVFTRSGENAACVSGVSPVRKPHDRFCALDGVKDPQQLARDASRKLKIQRSEAEMREEIDMTPTWRRETRPAGRIPGGLCSAPLHEAGA